MGYRSVVFIKTAASIQGQLVFDGGSYCFWSNARVIIEGSLYSRAGSDRGNTVYAFPLRY